MCELITTLENYSDLDALLASAADTILVAVEGLSSCVAEKLSLEQVSEVVEAASKAEKQVSIRANVTSHEGSLQTVEIAFAKLAEMNVHAIFFADPAMYMLAKKYGVVEKMIYDPETLMTSINDANWWLSRKIEGIAISPLLTLQETEEIMEAVKKAVVTVHGRTLMSRSYRKLLSAYKDTFQLDEKVEDNRSLTLIETKRDQRMPVYEDETGTFIYSDNVLDSFDFIQDVLAKEPMALLIEGSYLGAEEEVEAAKSYRRILNGESPVEVGKEYREKFQGEPLDSGYYEQKTVR